MNPFSIFDLIYCVNLDRRPDRWELAQKEFEKASILNRVERIPAVDIPKMPAQGNHLSHMRCIQKAKELGASNLLIFEDDIEWINDPLLLKRVIVPSDWDLLYLGVNTERQHFQINYHISKLTFAYSTHAYAINNTLYDQLIEINRDPATIHNDVRMCKEIIPNYNCYATIPLLAGQRKSYSDIMGMEMDSNPIFLERFKNNLVPKSFPVLEPTFVTFIIPTLGRPTLGRAVESIINQEEWNWKAIVMFDEKEINYSTDNDHVSIKRCENIHHAGLVRNEAMKYVTTDWIAFLDDDDWIAPDYVNSLRKYTNDYDVVVFTYKDMKTGNIQPPQNRSQEVLAGHVGISFAVRTDFIIKNNIEFTPYALEDYRFLDACRNAGARIILTHEIKYFVGGRSGWV